MHAWCGHGEEEGHGSKKTCRHCLAKKTSTPAAGTPEGDMKPAAKETDTGTSTGTSTESSTNVGGIAVRNPNGLTNSSDGTIFEEEEDDVFQLAPKRDGKKDVIGRIQCKRRWIELTSVGDAEESEKYRKKQAVIQESLKSDYNSYSNSLSSIEVVGPEPVRVGVSKSKQKYVCKDKSWVRRSRKTFSLLFRFFEFMVINYNVSTNLKKITKTSMKQDALVRVTDKLQFGNHPEIKSEKEFAKSAAAWLPGLYDGKQFVTLMLLLEDWMSGYYNSRELSAERMGIVKSALATMPGLTEEEKNLILIAMITVANWKPQHQGTNQDNK